MATFYLHDGTAPLGPFEPAQLVARPGFGPATMVYPFGATGQDAWKKAADVPEIAALLAAKAPPPPPPPSSAPPAHGITLTAAPARPAPEPAAAPAPAPAAAPAPEPVPEGPKLADPKEKLVLVVDDDEPVRSFIEMSVQLQGFQVVTAVDGNDALKKIDAKIPDLIITDLMMPGLGGYELLRALQGVAGRVPIFVITASVLDDSTVKLIKAEANVLEFVAKPVKVPKLVAALHANLKTRPK